MTYFGAVESSATASFVDCFPFFLGAATAVGLMFSFCGCPDSLNVGAGTDDTFGAGGGMFDVLGTRWSIGVGSCDSALGFVRENVKC